MRCWRWTPTAFATRRTRGCAPAMPIEDMARTPRIRQERGVVLDGRARAPDDAERPVHCKQLSDACEAGGTSFLTSGHRPGLRERHAPARAVGSVGALERDPYPGDHQLRDVQPAGNDRGHHGLREAAGSHAGPCSCRGCWASPGAARLRLLAEGRGARTRRDSRGSRTAARHQGSSDRAVSDRRGHDGRALRFEVQGIVDGQPALDRRARHDGSTTTWRPEWPKSNGSYRVLIEGVPSMQVEYEFQDEHGDHAVGGVRPDGDPHRERDSQRCAPRKAGLMSALDLPVITGKGLFRPNA